MNLNDYQKSAVKTAIYPGYMGIPYTALGLAGEAGEVANKVKKMIRDGKSLEECKEGLVAELGDVLWYIANLAHEIGVPLEYVALFNVEKLRKREQNETINGNGDER